MAAKDAAGRPNQRLRTRKDLLRAAARLSREGVPPTMEEVAAEALVSRATAYRYFAGVEALLAEAALDVAVPEGDALFAGLGDDPVRRVEQVDTALHDVIVANEVAIRTMLVQSLQRRLHGAGPDAELPARQNRRTPLLQAALAPARAQFRPAALRTLVEALALVVGTEGVIAARDVLQLDDARARKVKRWAIRALVEAARTAAPAD